MAHPNLQTNGASLEDCHTNFFALTDLCGIKWRKLTSEGYTPPSSNGVYGAHTQQGNQMRGLVGAQPCDYLNDPVLSSYQKCLSNDILCVWRRIPVSSVSSPSSAAFPPSFGGGFHGSSNINHTTNSSNGLNTLGGAKELWIFWYGEEPELTNLVAPEILTPDGEQGSWESGLSYECRSLLFKALHNLIERCLLSRDFIRLGKWFVQPEDGLDSINCIPGAAYSKGAHLSFCISFFVHGESTVCASIDVRHHPVVRRLTQRHLAAAQASNGGLHVLLVPYGLAATLSGQSYRVSDHVTRKLMDEWHQYYSVEYGSNYNISHQRTSGPGTGSGDVSSSELPDMVEVIVGNVRMRYPTCYVLVCDGDNAVNSTAFNQLTALEGGVSPIPPVSPTSSSSPTTAVNRGNVSAQQLSHQTLPSAVLNKAPAVNSWISEEAHRLAEQAWEDGLLSPSGLSSHSPEMSNDKETSNFWDFTDPSAKTNCTCAKSRRSKMSSGITSSGVQLGKMGLSSSKRSVVPFHHRASYVNPSHNVTKDVTTGTGVNEGGQDRVNRSGTSGVSSGSTTPAPTPSLPTYQRSLAALRGSTGNSHLQTQLSTSNSVGPYLTSPASVTPSPLPNLHSHQPASVPPIEAAIPALSPHPPASNDATSVLIPSTPAPSDHLQNDSSNKATPLGTANTPGGPKSNSAYSPYLTTIPSVDTPGWPHSAGPVARAVSQHPVQAPSSTSATTPHEVHGMKRPLLPYKEYERDLDSERTGPELLYDYSSVNAWLYHPVKIMKPSSPFKPFDAEKSRSPQADILTTSNASTAGEKASITTANAKLQNGVLPMDIDGLEGNDFDDEPGCKALKRKDPDDKEDDLNPLNSVNVSSKAANPISLYTSEGLQASYGDLDKIFDNSDESNDTCPVPTPPGSNKPAGLPEDTASLGKPRIAPAHPSPGSGTTLGSLSVSGVNILATAELSKMFPTPPSHEHPMQSPCGQFEGPVETTTDLSLTSNMSASQNGSFIKCEPGFSGCSPSYISEDPNKDWSYVYRPPTVWKQANSTKYAPLPLLPSQALSVLQLPPPYRPSFGTNPPHETPRPLLHPPMRPLTRMSMAANVPYYPRNVGPPPFSPISPSTLECGPSFAPHMSHPRHGFPLQFSSHMSPTSNTLKHLLQHQQVQQQQQIQQQQQQQPLLPECHSLMLNIVLGDSLLNVFRDHNFDSCALCVCSAGQNCIGTIRGPDAVFYLPESARAISRTLPPPNPYSGVGMGTGFLPITQDEESCRCNCGFSAIVNRRLAHQAGLFYEDEVEITGQASTQDPVQFKRTSLYAICHSDKEEQQQLMRSRMLDFAQSVMVDRKNFRTQGKESDKNDMVSNTIAAVVMEANAQSVDAVPVPLMELLREQCLHLHHSSSPFYRAAQLQAASRKVSVLHALELSDSCEAVKNALNLALYSSPMPLVTPPIHQQQQQPPPYQQHHWNPTPPTPHPYMPYNSGMSGFQPGFNPNVHPISPSLHSPTMTIRGRPPTPAALSSPIIKPPVPPSSSGPVVHYWPFLHVDGPSSSQDIVRVMRTLQPLLQESIHKKWAAQLWGAMFSVQGPLTWRQFHRMAVRGTEDHCEPQPIPAVLAGYDRDWVSIAPLAIPLWERLLLEPYSRPRDIAYVVVAPEVDFILAKTKFFFRELSSTYEMCRLGRHAPITKGLRDGILRVGRSAASKLANEPVDDWFANIGDSPVASILRLYARVCRYHLASHLTTLPMDRSLLDPLPNSSSNRPSNPVSSTMAPPTTTPVNTGEFPGNMGPPNPQGSMLSGSATNAPLGTTSTGEGKPLSPKTEQQSEVNEGTATSNRFDSIPLCSTTELTGEDEEGECPAIVIYILDPFSFASDSLDLERLATLGLLRCYQQMLSHLPESMQSNVSLQLLSLDTVLHLGKDFHGSNHSDSLRSLALNVFSQCKKFLAHSSNVKSLTGFGPAAASDQFLKSKDEKNRTPYRMHVPAYILAPSKDRTVCDLDPKSSTTTAGSSNGSTMNLIPRGDKFAVLYVSYCLSEDQRWLIATCTDERGEMFDSCIIGIDVPNRTKRKRVSARRYGLQRLMDFILGVLSTGVHPWRLVIGRLGRMGHGELKSWSTLLSRKSLLRSSRHIAEVCGQCTLMFPTDAPIIVSACVVSLEPDSQFRMMTDQVTPDERFGQQSANSSLSTPEDASCTHILVFPTSATTTSSQTTFQEQHMNDIGDDDLLSALNDDMGDGFEGMGDFNDIFASWPETDPVNDGNDDLTSDLTGGAGNGIGSLGGTSLSPGVAHGPPSPSRRSGNRGCQPESPSGITGINSGRQSPGLRSEQEEVGTLLQQPLALGYYVSTAPTGDMPTWFWSSCPHLARACPAFLKCALHLHNHAVQPSSDDLLLQQQQQNFSKVHPLDSPVTTDVLRYVMEGYNALSWLSLDPRTRDRRSCLPVHIQLLVQLYHALAALI